MSGLVDINDVLVRASMIVDDGCDWNEWLVWRMRKNYFIHQHVSPPPPARPKVAEVKIEPIKKPKKKRRTRNNMDEELLE